MWQIIAFICQLFCGCWDTSGTEVFSVAFCTASHASTKPAAASSFSKLGPPRGGVALPRETWLGTSVDFAKLFLSLVHPAISCLCSEIWDKVWHVPFLDAFLSIARGFKVPFGLVDDINGFQNIQSSDTSVSEQPWIHKFEVAVL